MTPYAEALEMLLKNINVMDVEEKPLLKSMGQVSAEDVSAEFDLPLSPISGPDGYAVRSTDIKGASRAKPVVLTIAETVRAGRMPRRTVKPGTAVRIMTGSVVPKGADCVVRFEDTDEPGGKNGPNNAKPREVKIYTAPSAGGNIRPSGSNTRKGTLIVPKGAVVGPARIAALAALGRKEIRVIRRPVIAIIASGDELVSPGQRLLPGRTYNANTSAMAALVAHYGGIPRILGIARDKEASIRAKIERAVTADAIITTGGVSMGDYDLVRLTLGKMGEVIFHRIKMGPGAALAFGVIPRRGSKKKAPPVPVFALAGPPMGCLVNFETLVRPALLKMRGFERLDHPAVEAKAVDAVTARMPMAFARWTGLAEAEGEYRVELNRAEEMGALASLASANSLTIIPEGTAIDPGDKVRVLPLDWVG